MRYLVILLLTAAMAWGSGTVVTWFNANQTPYKSWDTPQTNIYYGIQFNRTSTPGYPSQSFYVYAIEAYFESGSKVSFCLQPVYSPTRPLNEYKGYSIVTGKHQYELSTPLLVETARLNIGFKSDTGSIKIRTDNSRDGRQYMYWDSAGWAWRSITPSSQPGGDFFIGALVTNNTGVNPTSLGRIKSLYE